MTFWGVVLFFVCWREGDGMEGEGAVCFGSQLRSPSAKYLQ